MTKDKALKVALEALQAHGAAYLHHELRYEEAIIAIKEVLAQPEQDVDYWIKQHTEARQAERELLRELQAMQPEQEPVAWINSSTLISFQIDRERYPLGGYGDQSTARGYQGDYHNTPLFTSPPKEQQSCDKRQPLTDATLWEMWVESPSDVLRFARAIEAAHGIGEKT